MQEVSIVTPPNPSLTESESSANKRKRKNPSPGKLEADGEMMCTTLDNTEMDSVEYADEDSASHISSASSSSIAEVNDEDADDSCELESGDGSTVASLPPVTTPPPHIASPVLSGPSPTSPRLQPQTPTSTSPPGAEPRIVMKFILPQQQQAATMSPSTPSQQLLVKRGPGRPPGSGGRPRGRPKGSTSGERKSPGRPRIHPPKENQPKRPRGRPRIHPPKEQGEKRPRGRPASNPKYVAIKQTNEGLEKRVKDLEGELRIMEEENGALKRQLMELGVDTASITRQTNKSFSPRDFKLRVVLQSPTPPKRPARSDSEDSPCEKPIGTGTPIGTGEPPVKKKRGRPRLHFKDPNTPKRGPGRPRLHPKPTPSPASPLTPKRRGRPPKSSYIPVTPTKDENGGIRKPISHVAGYVAGTPDKQLSISPTKEPTPTSPTKQPAPTSPTKQPTPTSPTKEPTPTSPTKQPAPTSPTKEPTPTPPTKEPTPTSPTKEPTPTSPTKEPTPTSPTKQPAPTSPTIATNGVHLSPMSTSPNKDATTPSKSPLPTTPSKCISPSKPNTSPATPVNGTPTGISPRADVTSPAHTNGVSANGIMA